jgi:Fe-S cluster biosynthesis and repair protein YggX
VKISNKNFSFFSTRNQNFPHIPYVASKKIFQKFQKKMVQEGRKHQKMLRETSFWPSAGRESLWTTGKKVEFSKAYCEVQKQPNLDFSI